MRLLLITDTHGKLGSINELATYVQADAVLHAPVRIGFQLVEYLNDNPNATYDDLSVDAGITKAQVCQMLTLCKRLPTEITEFLINAPEPEILRYFTERMLRPLTLLASDKDKIKTSATFP